MERKPERGLMLVALPTLLDPNFRQTLVLLCEHGPEGTMGLVINRPTEVEVSALVDEFPALSQSGLVYSGGPVSKNAMLVLFRDEVGEEEGHGILDNVFLAKNLEMFRGSGFSDQDVRCYLGYAGWGPGQLENEMKSGAWALMPADPGMVFESDPSLLWQDMMQRLGGDWSVYASLPADPSLN
jgi:putative transcriptional regulator